MCGYKEEVFILLLNQWGRWCARSGCTAAGDPGGGAAGVVRCVWRRQDRADRQAGRHRRPQPGTSTRLAPPPLLWSVAQRTHRSSCCTQKHPQSLTLTILACLLALFHPPPTHTHPKHPPAPPPPPTHTPTHLLGRLLQLLGAALLCRCALLGGRVGRLDLLPLAGQLLLLGLYVCMCLCGCGIVFVAKGAFEPHWTAWQTCVALDGAGSSAWRGETARGAWHEARPPRPVIKSRGVCRPAQPARPPPPPVRLTLSAASALATLPSPCRWSVPRRRGAGEAARACTQVGAAWGARRFAVRGEEQGAQGRWRGHMPASKQGAAASSSHRHRPGCKYDYYYVHSLPAAASFHACYTRGRRQQHATQHLLFTGICVCTCTCICTCSLAPPHTPIPHPPNTCTPA